jgi:C4-dicarboxylate-specific signal transduction histidine kinase
MIVLNVESACAQATAPPSDEKNVLLLLQGNGGSSTSRTVAQRIVEQMMVKNGPRIHVQLASTDPLAESNPRLSNIEKEWFRARYAGVQFDLVIATAESPFVRAQELRDAVWPGTPIVFCCFDSKTFLASHRFHLTTGIIYQPDWRGNIRLAGQLFPETQHLALTGGATESDHSSNDPIAKIVHEEYPAIDFIDLTGLPLTEQLARARRLPPKTVVMYGSIIADITGKNSLPLPGGFRGTLMRDANAPVFFAYGTIPPSGGLEGYVAEPEDLGREVGDLATSVLSGWTRPDAPPLETRAIQLRLDWREIQRWNIPASRIPKNALIEFAPPSLWDTHKDTVTVAIIAFVAQFLLIAFLVEERRRRQASQKLLAERLRFETLLAQVSSEFADVANDRMDSVIQDSLRAVQGFFESSTASIWESQDAGSVFQRTHVWPRDMVWPSDADGNRLDRFSANDFKGTILRLFQGENILFSNDAERANLEDAESFCRLGIQSFLAIPLRDEERVIGFLSMANRGDEASWAPDIVPRLRVIAEILGGALARRNASRALQESQLMKFSLLESMQSSVAVIDQDGLVLEVNQQWLNSSANDITSLRAVVSAGTNYLDACRKAGNGVEVVLGIQSVLSGSRHIFESEYDDHSSEQHWFRMTVRGLPKPHGGAVVTHLDITERKLSELDQQRTQEELFQLNRVAEMGQLTASLAHELAQPLAAVLSNAQAAAQLASHTEPDLVEVRSALADIIEDDQRARTILNNMRSILKKHTVTPHRINLNEIVESVTVIVRSNAQLRGIQLRSGLSPEAVFVQGDEVPLQQVLLNLINNAMDAMSHLPAERRILTLKTCLVRQKSSGLLMVEDDGPGIPAALKDRLFAPFFTTKSDGLGMGLAICRVILQSLGGSISCQNRPGNGAVFHVELPLAP